MSLATLTTGDKGRKKIPAYSEHSLNGSSFLARSSISFPDSSGNPKHRLLELRIAQSVEAQDDIPEHPHALPLVVALREEVDNHRYEDVYFYTNDNHLMMHGWRVISRNESGSFPQPQPNNFSYDRDAQKLLKYGEAISSMINKNRLAHGLEEHPTVQRLRSHTLWDIQEGTMHFDSIRVPTRRESFLYGAFFHGEAIFDSANPNEDQTPKYLELTLAQSKLDEEAPDFLNMILPLTVGLHEVKGNSGYEDVYLFTPDNHFMMHGWRQYQRDPQSRSRVYQSSDLVFDRDMKKLLQEGEQVSYILRNRRFAPSLEEHPTVQRLRSHTLWELPHDIA